MASSAARRGSGRFLLRLSPDLHARLQAAARAQGLSLNEYCVRRLAAPATGLLLDPDAAAAVTRAEALVGNALEGVIVYGSWTRGEATDRSDVDLLIVVDRRVPLSRAIYRRWDESPVGWHGRAVDPHFVHLPAAGREVTGGAWCEAAIDGVVLFERDDRISARLRQVRRDLAAGRLVRRTVHGQPYWTGAA
jgi:uncharacterized protein (DUF1778 family)